MELPLNELHNFGLFTFYPATRNRTIINPISNYCSKWIHGIVCLSRWRFISCPFPRRPNHDDGGTTRKIDRFFCRRTSFVRFFSFLYVFVSLVVWHGGGFFNRDLTAWFGIIIRILKGSRAYSTESLPTPPLLCPYCRVINLRLV